LRRTPRPPEIKAALAETKGLSGRAQARAVRGARRHPADRQHRRHGAHLPPSQWISVFATTNIYFHLSTAYGILRSKGTPIGKIDLFAGGL
jgi:hypothetical protein